MTVPRGDDFRVAEVIRIHAAERGDRVALRHEQRELTYAQLDERTSRLAQAMLASGAGPGARVAYLDRTAPEAVELLLAAAKVGAVAVPLNWRLAEPELLGVLRDSAAPLLIAGPTYAATARALAAELPDMQLVMVDSGDPEGYEAWLAAHEPRDPGLRGDAADAVLQMYTSGTTGVPKGVLTTHRNLAACAETSPHWHFDADTISLTAVPMFHIGGIGWAFCGLWHGATTVLVGEFVPERILELLESLRVTNTIFVPTMLQMLTSIPGAADRDYSQLRSIAYGASPITTPVLKDALRTFGCELFGSYGLTETTGTVVRLEPEDHDPDGPREYLLRSAGKPYPWVQMRIAEPETGAELPPGNWGEVWLRAPNVMAGYWGRPEETAAALTPDGWLRTGDGGFVDQEGYLFLTDRIKDMIVSGGENVYPVEVEEVLAQHAAVADVAVIGTPHERWGETVTALIVARPGSTASAEDVVVFARERLAGYKLPRLVEFVDKLPRTPSGKVLKRELRDRYATIAR
jgi:acyl-CoA synthetase (AMP-forming)/AMP-acid ligase II